MKKRAIILIDSNPRKTHLPCEGLRIALGLASSGHHVSVILAHHGIHVLSEETDDFIDEDRLLTFLPALKDAVPIFSVDEESVGEQDLSEIDCEVALLSKEAIASNIAEADCFFRF